MINIYCINISIKNLSTLLTFIILFVLIQLTPVNAWSKDKATTPEHKLYAKVGLDLGHPFGVPGIHFEIGHANLAGFFGAGWSAPCITNRGLLHLDKPCPVALLLGVVASPVPSEWGLRPRLMALFTNESVYFHYRAHNYDHPEWKTFHEERFPGFSVLLELEITPKKLGLSENSRYKLELGYGINKPFKGCGAIKKLESDIEDRITHEPDYYDEHVCVSCGNFHHSLRIGMSWQFGI